MSDRILCVDDDPSILAGFQRTLRRLGEIDIAPTGGDALQMMETFGPYAVVVADMNMPGMDGITVLARAREIAPNTMRVMLTGDSDQHTAMQAVNEGQIFRFLAKPCPPDALALAVTAAVQQYHLLNVERDLLQRTLSGTIHVLTEILEIMDPSSFGRSRGLRERIKKLCAHQGITDTWEIDVAAMLANLGNITLPPMVLLKIQLNDKLLPAEQAMYDHVPEAGAALIANIPRLEGVAKLVRYYRKDWSGLGPPAEPMAGAQIPLGARVLRLLLDLDQLLATGCTTAAALEQINGRSGCYDPALVAALAEILSTSGTVKRAPQRVSLSQLRVGMRLCADILSVTGQKVIPSGQMVTMALIERLRNFTRVTTLHEPFIVDEPN